MDNNNKCIQLWQDILTSIVTTMIYLIGLKIVYGKLCKKIEIYGCKHGGRRQPRFTPGKFVSSAPGEEFSAEAKLESEQKVTSQWLNKHPEAGQLQKQNVQANNRITGSTSRNSLQSLTSQHSDSDDEIHYTTIVFGDSKHGPSTVENQNVNVHYENVSP